MPQPRRRATVGAARAAYGVPVSPAAEPPTYSAREAAELLGVSDDTVRRWVDSGALPAHRGPAGRLAVPGAELAAFARTHAGRPAGDPSGVARSARNRFVGLVTSVVADGVMAQVELQCGPHRVTSLMSSEAARELGLEPGRMAVAVVKATTVIVETPAGAS
ncbi:helix-turn-helix domain-containing protein [Quadrisphaera sp. INWT6]|nr:helix-turn-helix domain-containing protein [Quadrisphaera sp. INWT6]